MKKKGTIMKESVLHYEGCSVVVQALKYLGVCHAAGSTGREDDI